MDADDEAVLNLIAECEWDLSNPPGNMSSSQKEHDADLHYAQESRHLLSPLSIQHQCGDSARRGHEKKKVTSRGCPGHSPQDQLCGELPPQHGLPEACHLHVQHARIASQPDSVDVEDCASSSQKSTLPSQKILSPKLCSAAAPERRSTLEMALLEALLDLIDRCSSGSGSLHGNEAFLAQARQVLSSLQEFTAARDGSALEKEGVGYLSLENKALQSRLTEQHQQYAAAVTKVTTELNNTKRELDTLRQHLDNSLEENDNLKSLLYNVKQEVKHADTSGALSLQITGLQTSMKQLSGEVMELKQHVAHYDKIQELTQMLQESHSSLVSTNEHLLQELSRARAQHRAEVEQMHWSFQELKKTTALAPHRSSRLGGRQSC